MVFQALAAKLSPAIAAGIAAVVIGTGAHASIEAQTPSISESGANCSRQGASVVCDSLFDGSKLLYPGAPPLTRSLSLTYAGPRVAMLGGLFLSEFTSRAAQSSSLCTAADPAAGFELTVTASGRTIYGGSLSDFAAEHSDSGHVLSLRDGWRPGESVPVTLAVTMPDWVGNEYEGCASAATFAWFAE